MHPHQYDATLAASSMPANVLAYGVNDAARAAGVCRTSIYEALKRGDLVARKAGRRTVIEGDALRSWIASWPVATFGDKRAA